MSEEAAAETPAIAVVDRVTLNSFYGPATQIVDQAQADAYFESMVEYHLQSCAKQGIERTREEAEEMERKNLAFFAGHYDSITRSRVERLFRAVHPILGSLNDQGHPTPEEAALIGIRHAQRMRARGLIR